MQQTKHSIQRSQMRGVPMEIVEFIYKNGSSINTHTHKKFFINKKKLESMKFKEKDFIKKYDRHILNTVIVCNGDTLITVIKPNKRIKWN